MKAVRLHLGIPELNKYAGPLDSCCYSRTYLEMDGTQLRGPDLALTTLTILYQLNQYLKNFKKMPF